MPIEGIGTPPLITAIDPAKEEIGAGRIERVFACVKDDVIARRCGVRRGVQSPQGVDTRRRSRLRFSQIRWAIAD